MCYLHRKIEVSSVNGGGQGAYPPTYDSMGAVELADPPCVVRCWGRRIRRPTRVYESMGAVKADPPCCMGADRCQPTKLYGSWGLDECQPTTYELSVWLLGTTKSWVTPHSTQAPNVTWSLLLQVGSRSEVHLG